MKEDLIKIATEFLITETVGVKPLREYTLNDTSTLSDFESETEIIAHLVKDPKIKAHTGGEKNLYFDGAQLVFGDVTVANNLVFNDGFSTKVKLGDLKKMILQTPSLNNQKAGKARPAGKQKIGKFDVEIPTQLSGIRGSNAKDLAAPRLIITANDAEANAIMAMRDATKGIKVRIMKRSGGNKVYVDFVKSPAEVDGFISRLEKMPNIKEDVDINEAKVLDAEGKKVENLNDTNSVVGKLSKDIKDGGLIGKYLMIFEPASDPHPNLVDTPEQITMGYCYAIATPGSGAAGLELYLQIWDPETRRLTNKKEKVYVNPHRGSYQQVTYFTPKIKKYWVTGHGGAAQYGDED